MTIPQPLNQTDGSGAGRRVVYVALGSNLGDRASFLAAARRQLQDVGEVVAVSPIYDTEAVTPDAAAALFQPSRRIADGS